MKRSYLILSVMSTVLCTFLTGIGCARSNAGPAAKAPGQKYLGATPPPDFVAARLKARENAPKPGQSSPKR